MQRISDCAEEIDKDRLSIYSTASSGSLNSRASLTHNYFTRQSLKNRNSIFETYNNQNCFQCFETRNKKKNILKPGKISSSVNSSELNKDVCDMPCSRCTLNLITSYVVLGITVAVLYFHHVSYYQNTESLVRKMDEISIVLPKLADATINFKQYVSREMTQLRKITANIQQIVKEELGQYDADKTGRSDFALESAGGRILTTRNTELYVTNIPTLTIFGITLCYGGNGPNSIIQASTLPGECWAFQGSTGSVVIRLLGDVMITGVSLEHISMKISPTGDISSAPKDFSIWGLKDENDSGGFMYGQFVYDAFGPALQYFPVQYSSDKPHNTVELKILSNHGNKDYTCVYRLRVHGSLHEKDGCSTEIMT